MKILNYGRAAGKTFSLIKHAAETGATIVSYMPKEIDTKAKFMLEQGFIKRLPPPALTIQQCVNNNEIKNVCIDELGIVLRKYLNWAQIELVTTDAETTEMEIVVKNKWNNSHESESDSES